MPLRDCSCSRFDRFRYNIFQDVKNKQIQVWVSFFSLKICIQISVSFIFKVSIPKPICLPFKEAQAEF